MKKKSIWKKKANKLTLAEALLASCEITAVCVAAGGICELIATRAEANRLKREAMLEETIKYDLISKYDMKLKRKD